MAGSDLVGAVDDLGDQTVLDGGLGPHPEVPLGVLDDLLVGLAGFLGDHAVDALAHLHDLLGLDLDVAGLAADAAHGLAARSGGWAGGRGSPPGGPRGA